MPAGSAEGGRWTDGGGGGSAPDGTPIDPAAEVGGQLIDLATEELAGGHTIQFHVGKSERQLLQSLRERISEEIDRGAFGESLKQGFRLGSFPSLEAANKLVNATISKNKSEIEAYILAQTSFLRVASFFDSPTGMEAYAANLRSQPYIRQTDGVAVILFSNPLSARGLSIRTAFPTNEP